MRLFNEGATLLLFAIVFLVILKNGLNMVYGLIGLMAFAALLMVGYKIYKRYRNNKGQ
jgi:putative membrane protein